jgi:hypothetical protein
MQTRIEPGKSAKYSFDSLSELGEYILRTDRTWPSRESVDAHKNDQYWDLSAGYTACVKMARCGWNEGAAKVQDALKAFAPATPAPDTKTDIYGFRPHVPRFCAGAPDSMIRHTNSATMGSGRVLTLAVPVNALAAVNATSMANFGVAVAQYVNQLEMQGTRVELIGMIVSDVSGQRCAHSWTVKRADQPLDLAVIAFTIGHPGMFRRLGFALRERSAVKYSPGYGNTVSATLSDLINPPPGTVILNGMADANSNAPTAAKALEYVSKQIEKTIEAQHGQ